MDLSSQLVPAVVLLAANLLSGKRSSLRWEFVTAIFGWGACFSIVAYAVLSIFASNSSASDYLLQTGAFCLITALGRDYEKILSPIFPWNRY